MDESIAIKKDLNQKNENVVTKANFTARADNTSKGIFYTKYLIFTLDNKRYGIPLSAVKEVIGMSDFTPVPHAPKFFQGLINLRGKIHSVIDLRIKLNLLEHAYESKKTAIIITEIGDYIIGSIVDDVNEVIGFEDSQIENNLRISSSISQEYIAGVAKNATGSLTLLLNINKILGPRELVLIKRAA